MILYSLISACLSLTSPKPPSMHAIITLTHNVKDMPSLAHPPLKLHRIHTAAMLQQHC